MEILASLQPRSAGSAPLEVRTTFVEDVVAASAQVRCPLTCGCYSGTSVCVSTGTSKFYVEN